MKYAWINYLAVVVCGLSAIHSARHGHALAQAFLAGVNFVFVLRDITLRRMARRLANLDRGEG